ncbi:ABC transporter ATP-binding protein [Planomonospora parontospora subsp. parontospora]|uniref:ABC transporter ATP-binding protein n=2 Tax=Planomonospora parontospora TaxID=58119 RepID=A0AA37BC18_9ACTN|nr:ATP-binding cassette domain-containing protein [Planomonospora parontospora]GGK48985.1 ABC transporter ATP-binding protein [Planomonospora parontospora]GII06771.1 ABC transporter ATP-binding protein [Planomonospora parontospora subsp. parontospora]
MLEARDVTVRYGRQVVLDGVSLTVEPGRVTGLAGPSGCGKSTLARVLALMLRPAAGTVTVDGAAVRRWRQRAPRGLRTAVALLYQQPRLAVDPRLTLTEIIAEPLAAAGRADPGRVAALAAEAGLTGDLLGRRPHEVSDGQLQRACVARALSLEPRYLVCDEMTTMLDASTQAHLVAVVEAYRERSGAGVLAVSHDDALLARWAHHRVRLGGFEGLES